MKRSQARHFEQLDLPCSLTQLQQAQEELTILRGICVEVTDELETLRVQHAALQKQHSALEKAHQYDRQEIERLRQTASALPSLRDLCEFLEQRAASPSRELCTRLLSTLTHLMHPDKWSQGQPASVLAHEAMVVLNNVRKELKP